MIMIYKCNFCNKEFDKKYNFDRHRLHVKYCVENKVNPIIETPKKDEPKLICDICKKSFKNKFTLKRHQLKSCIKIETINTSNIPVIEENIENIITETINKMKEDNVVVANITINNYPNQKVKNTIKQTNIINCHNLNAFGKEDLSHITDEIIKKIFNNPSSSVIKMIKEIHFNEECPENMNVRQTNLKINLIDLFNGVDWEKHNKEEVIHNLIASKKDILDEIIEKINLEKIKKEEYGKISNELDTALYKNMLKQSDSKTIQKYNTIDTKILRPISNGINHFLANRKLLQK